MKTLITISILALSTVALAEKMTAEDAAKLDAATAHEAIILQQMAPYEKTITEICKKYHIDRQELGKTVGVDVNNGEIQRKSPPPAPKK